MRSRVYLLLDIIESKVPDALHALQNACQLITVDRLEGHPNVIAVIEAADRQQLADILMPALDSVDRIARDVRILMNHGAASVPVNKPAEAAVLAEHRTPEMVAAGN